jgi:hypothetical protein
MTNVNATARALEQCSLRERIKSGALAELATLVDPNIDIPLYHDVEFLRGEIARITAQVRIDIDAAKAEYLAK